jgi:hypothetical protein
MVSLGDHAHCNGQPAKFITTNNAMHVHKILYYIAPESHDDAESHYYLRSQLLKTIKMFLKILNTLCREA